MSDTWIENAIVESIDMIVNKRISQASFDTTIKAIVKSCTDETIGEYVVRYQDSDLTVYSNSVDSHYVEGDLVLIHVPRNDLTKRKTILGSTTLLATTYQSIPTASSLYNKIGTNIITKMVSSTLKLSSYESTLATLWELGGENNLIEINKEGLDKYIQRGNGLAVGMYVRTDFSDTQTGGDYGLIINLKFIDANGVAAVRPYIVSSKDVIGNPYRLTKPTFVLYLIEDINISLFDGILSIQIYDKGFPEDKTKTNIYDIFFSLLQIFGAGSLTQEELTGYSLHIDYSKDGDTIETVGEGDLKKIKNVLVKAELKAKGKVVTKNVNYYWFRLNGRVFRGSSYGKYSMYGGDGWECLNYYSSDDPKHPVPRTKAKFTFVPDTSSLEVKDGVAALSEKATKIKCVAVIDNQEVANGECIIYNNTITTTLSIVSSDKTANDENRTIYYLDNGNPTLTCKAVDDNTRKTITEDLNYEWTIVPARGDAIDCNKEDKEDDPNPYRNYTEEEDTFLTQYNAFVKEYNKVAEADKTSFLDKLKSDKSIKNKSIYGGTKNDNGSTLFSKAKKKAKLLKAKSRVELNKFYKFPISSISNYSKIICTVSKKVGETWVVQGHPSIVLYNKPLIAGMYSLNLENGTKVFQYDKKGNSPTSSQLLKPLVLLPLTFTLLDNTGKEIPFKQITNKVNQGYVKWYLPKNNTMLSYTGTIEPIALDNYYVYNATNDNGLEVFPYAIVPQYDAKNNQNDIKLTVKYKDVILLTYTNFTFPKDGDPGTNGTDFVAKLVPNLEDAESVYVTNFTRKNYDISDNLPFDNQGRSIDRLNFLLYNNSIKVESGYTAHNDNDNEESSILKQKSSLVKSNSSKQLCRNSENSVNTENFLEWVNTNKPVDIIRQYAVVNDIKYYAEYPVYFNCISNKNYRIKLKPKTGFKYVVYSDDGTLPDYDNTLPFEVVTEKLIEDNGIGYYQVLDEELKYSWKVIGKFLKISGSKTKVTCTIVPAEKYDGDFLASAVVCTVTAKDNTVIGHLHMPVYMCINRYGHAALNEWDGNSIDLKLDKDGKPTGDVILAPQVGAGKKNDNNTFTGVLIGVEKLNNESKDRTGLFGYSEGLKSIFLDADTGNATFGKQGAAQIKIDATSGLGTIASGDYPEDITGKPAGMKIKFSSTKKDKNDEQGPYIKYGTGNFSVNAQGHVHAAGGGDIAGWQIRDNRLFKDTTSDFTTPSTTFTGSVTGMRSTDNPAFYAYEKTVKTDKDGKQISDLTIINRNFYVNHSGYLFSQSGKIGGWDIKLKTLSNSNVGMNSDPDNSSYKVSGYKSKAFFANGDKFYVTHDGYLRSTSGKIANWDIQPEELSYTSSTNNSTTTVGMGTKRTLSRQKGDDISNAKFWSQYISGNKKFTFAVTQTGRFYADSGEIGGWTINEDSISVGAKGKNNIILHSSGSLSGGKDPDQGTGWNINDDGSASFNGVTTTNMTATSATVSGNITADTLTANTSGTIGGFTIGAKTLTGGKLTLNSAGSMSGPSWSIASNGNASFSKLSGTLTGALTTGTNGSFTSGDKTNGFYAPHGSSPTIYSDKAEIVPKSGKLVSNLVLNRYSGPYEVTRQFVQKEVVTGVDFDKKEVTTENVYVASNRIAISKIVYGWNKQTTVQDVKFMINIGDIDQTNSEDDVGDT